MNLRRSTPDNRGQGCVRIIRGIVAMPVLCPTSHILDICCLNTPEAEELIGSALTYRQLAIQGRSHAEHFQRACFPGAHQKYLRSIDFRVGCSCSMVTMHSLRKCGPKLTSTHTLKATIYRNGIALVVFDTHGCATVCLRLDRHSPRAAELTAESALPTRDEPTRRNTVCVCSEEVCSNTHVYNNCPAPRFKESQTFSLITQTGARW